MSMHHTVHKDGSAVAPLETVAGNGLLDRRALLGRGIALAGAVGTGVGTSLTAAAEPLSNGPWSLAPRRTHPALRPAVKIRAESGAYAEQSQARAPRTRHARHTISSTARSPRMACIS